ncbi:MAG TPA: alpha/beta fold hydrolase [Bacteroidales bacterium]|nr:alpha/beta fold hydrolase [Bacteroidales bacterium]HPT11148.1 alpha/beta fold hydrolase [Bacteroidales bacterium]
MKKRLLFILLATLTFPVIKTAGQISDERIVGSWIGHITASAMDVRIVFHFSTSPSDTLVATLDSPDQSVEGLKLGRVIHQDSLVLIDATNLRIQYTGVIRNDTLIDGTWKQSGKEYQLNIQKMKAPLTVNRPQEPHPPFPYAAEEVSFMNKSENFSLAGTLTIPQGNGPFPGVVLITGSGYEDRDETVFNHKPFLVIADYLTRRGIAVLRYDDRATAKSGGNKTNATSLNLAGDAAAAVDYLMSRPEIDHNKIGLAGHSEGSFIAAITASERNDIAFIVSLAGPGIKGEEVILRQTRDMMTASGSDTAAVNENDREMHHLFDIIKSEKDPKNAFKKSVQWYNTFLDSKGVTDEKRKEEMSTFTKKVLAVNSAWFRYFLTTEPSQFWRKVKCPVLALNGEKDMQVYYRDNLDGIAAALKQGGNRKVTVISLPGHNHLFQHCKTGLGTEYATIEETFSPVALEKMSDWITETTRKTGSRK